MDRLTIIGGGLAGCEAAWQAANRGVKVDLFEMRPGSRTAVHQSANLAELVCSNSLGSNLPDRASGLLADELRQCKSLLIRCADLVRIPAGHALAVDRERFSKMVQSELQAHASVSIHREEIKKIPCGPVIIASGPLTSPAFASEIQLLCGLENLFFFDALAPIVRFRTIDLNVAFWGSRYQKGIKARGDYLNCPFSEDEYRTFVDELAHAERITLKAYEQSIDQGVNAGKGIYFEGCLPIEVMAQRGPMALAFGPLRPIGIRNPHNDQRPFAIAQLRQDDAAADLFNLVGFQTNLKFKEQERVFRMIPGLEKADFVRFGQMHRNTFIQSPLLLKPSLQSRIRSDLFFAGQVTGMEGYLGSIASGLVAGINISRQMRKLSLIEMPRFTMIGSLCSYISESRHQYFQPMKANFGLMPPLHDEKINKKQKGQAYLARSRNALEPLCNILMQ